MTFAGVDTLGRRADRCLAGRLDGRSYGYSGVRYSTAPARLSVGVRLADSDT